MQGAGSTVIGASGTLAMDASVQPAYLGLDTRTLTNNGTATYKPSAGGTGAASLYLGYNCSGNPTSLVNNATLTYNGESANDTPTGSICDADTISPNAAPSPRRPATAPDLSHPTSDTAGTVSSEAH